ncbi:MAG: HDIG domain-containing protein [Polyangiaceae bacterium]|nr:HDIG domain-containing protein [Polyangiaceae bacterium]
MSNRLTALAGKPSFLVAAEDEAGVASTEAVRLPRNVQMLRTRVRAGAVAGLVMSLVFAAFLTLVQLADRYVEAWAPAFGQKTATTLRVPYGPRLVRTGVRTRLHFEDRRTVVPRGTVLRPDKPDHQAAYLLETEQRSPTLARMGGVFVILFTLILALTAYLRRFAQNRMRLLRMQVGLLVAMGLLAVGAKAVMLFTALPAIWIPVATVPLLVASAFDRRTASIVAVVMAFIVASQLQFDLIFLCVLIARGMATTLFYLGRKASRQVIASGLLAGLTSAAFYAAIIATFEGRFDLAADLAVPLQSELIACLGGGLGAGLLAVAFRAPAERLLGNVPRERLLELQDLSQPLLLKLAREAPGTFEHSRAMANLAEQAASAIGVDALLTRIGAYYHDLGKTAQAKYFVENLLPDEPSPHDLLEPEVSADAIMAHVPLGAKILRQGGVPEPVVEFSYTHHGTSLVEYFWNKCLQQGNPKGLVPADFTYPGMKPQTKEAAILMLVDSIEAASRTVDRPTQAQFSQMIERIVFTKLEQGQLDECGLDLTELRIVTTRMTETLVNMYHHRIKYQWQVQRAEEFGVPSQAVRASAPDLEFALTSASLSLPPPRSSEAPQGSGATVSQVVPTLRPGSDDAEGANSGPREPMHTEPSGPITEDTARSRIPRVTPKEERSDPTSAGRGS